MNISLKSATNQYNRCIRSSALIYGNTAAAYATYIGIYRQRSSLAAYNLSYFMRDDTTSFTNPNKDSNCHGIDECNNKLLNINNDWNTSFEQHVGVLSPQHRTT